VNSLPDAERDACEVVRALASLAAILGRPSTGLDEETRVLLTLAADGGLAAERVLAYLRGLRGAGDGEAVAVPPRLGQWRDWVPPRGNVLSEPGRRYRTDEVPNRLRRGDPGE